jgi:hypothetical protein
MGVFGRRGFLSWLGLGGLVSYANLKAPSEAVLREIVLLETFVAGFQFHEGMQPGVFAQLASGVEVTLKREAENEHDCCAVAVHTAAGQHIGYVPRSENQMLAKMMDQGARLKGRVTTVDREAETWERVGIRVEEAT